MTITKSFSYMISILKNMLILQVCFLCVMTIFRFVFFLNFASFNNLSTFKFDILEAFYYGMRLDSTCIGYVQALATIVLIALYIVKKEHLFELSKQFFLVYFVFFYLLFSLLLTADSAFYSYYSDHINPLFFGIIDDDTEALWNIFLTNYNVFLICVGVLCYIITMGMTAKKVLFSKKYLKTYAIKLPGQIIVVFLMVLLNFIIIRGSFGTFPFGHYLPDISTSRFVNGLTQNGVRAFVKAYKIRRINKRGEYDLIKEMGYSGRMEDAFKTHLSKTTIDTKNLLLNITTKTPENKHLEQLKPHIVVIMVEGFGSPLFAYDSKEFNVLGAMKKHFDEDYLFTNFVSDGNGTIGSTESLVLNIPRRPDASFFVENKYLNTSFTYAPSFVYQKKGYETSFVYGGDASWRDVGDFFSKQGFDHVETQTHIIEKLNLKNNCCHLYGVFDGYLYDFLYEKIKHAEKPQFIFALSTNNHAPFTIPSAYQGRRLTIPENLKKQIIGDVDLAFMRFKDYQYAIDMVGKFVDKIKNSDAGTRTIIAITADNNTISSILSYPENEMFNSKNIPLYMYLPESLKPETRIDTKVFGSHKDIFPTLYQLSLSNTEYIAIGTDLLNPQKLHYGFNSYRIVFGKNGWAQLNTKKNDESNKMLKYYRASMAVTEYLVQQQLNPKVNP